MYCTCYVFFVRSGSVETVGGNSEGTGTTETSTSQTPSCRALAGTVYGTLTTSILPKCNQ